MAVEERLVPATSASLKLKSSKKEKMEMVKRIGSTVPESAIKEAVTPVHKCQANGQINSIQTTENW